MNLCIVFLAISFVLFDFSLAVTTKYCGGDKNAHLEVTDCSDESGTPLNPCILKQGKTYRFELKFKPDHDESKPVVSASASVLGITRELPISKVNKDYHVKPCDFVSDKSGIECPLKAGKENSYTVDLPITSEMKLIPVNAQFKITGSDGKPIVCLSTQVKAA